MRADIAAHSGVDFVSSRPPRRLELLVQGIRDGEAGLRRGDRREYFSAPPEALDSMLASASAIYRQMREIAERGLAANPDHSSSARARLEEFRDVMVFIEREIPTVIRRFLDERAATRTRPAE